jgi:hypothetical protein
MSLVKWMRKYNKRIMAVVVIILMFAFIGGYSLQYILQGSGGANQAVAYYGQSKKIKITRYKMSEAMQELEILQYLRMDAAMQQVFGMRGLLLGELVFSQSRSSVAAMNRAIQIIHQCRLPVSDEQLSEMYQRTVSPAIYWILLRQEAESAGIRTPPAQAGAQLASWLPQLFPDQTGHKPDEIYKAVMNSVVNRFRVSDRTVVEIVGRMLAVLEYASTICSTEDITIPELTHMASWAGDTLDADAVQLEARVFADKQSTPTDDALRAQFDKYKGNFSGDVSEDNLFGFGYKLPDRVQFDYVALKLSDVAQIVPAPTDEDAMEYYRQNRGTRFTQQVPSDPNDPNSRRVPRVRKYTEVKELILEQLRQQRINTKAEQVLDEVRTLADTNLEMGASEGKGLSVEQLKAKAGDYNQIAQQVAAKDGITLYSGQTGWLSAMDIESDEHLGRLYVSGQGMSNVPLTQAVFSVDAFGPDAAVLLFAAKPRMYATIGPIRNSAAMRSDDLSGQIMMVARIVGANKAGEPENLDVTYSTKTLDLGEPAKAKKDQTYSVKQQVTKDLQMLAAWDATRAKAEEFVALASKEGWEPASAKFNDLYGKQAKEAPNDPNVFSLTPMTTLRRMPSVELQTIAVQAAGSPVGLTDVYRAEVEKRRIDLLFSLVPPDATSAPNMPQVVEFKPGQSFYAIKSISAHWLSQQQYDLGKATLLQWEDNAQMQGLAVAHFNPGNILKRTNFRYAKAMEPKTEAEPGATKQKSKGTR